MASRNSNRGDGGKRKPKAHLMAIIPTKGKDGEAREEWVELCALWETNQGDASGTIFAIPLHALHANHIRVFIKYPR